MTEHPPVVLRWRRNTLLTAFGLLMAGVLLVWLVQKMRPRETRWTMINVSSTDMQADCHLLEFPDGSRALIDVADAWNTLDTPGLAVPYLLVHKINHLSLVVLSHFHRDHYGRLVDLINAGIKVDRVALNLPASRAQMDREHQVTPLADWDDALSVLQFLRDRQIPYFTPKAGERLVDMISGGVPVRLEVVCLYDGTHTPIGETVVNDTSIILRLSHGSTRALFTGDLTGGLGSWLAGNSSFDLAADLLKVQHHGADWNASDEIFIRINPKAALVPAPASLWYSFRDKRIRDYLAGHHIPTYVSGINGTVTVTMTAQGFTIAAEHHSN